MSLEINKRLLILADFAASLPCNFSAREQKEGAVSNSVQRSGINNLLRFLEAASSQSSRIDKREVRDDDALGILLSGRT